ncbi:MAG: hypothetical protein KJ970_12275 [Candidatus Eisenbacteria bacterium]|uniref:Outer membrane protein beta-barrel domain-containing protein n=1 Tax=Eiseniibacteriota bacterium TaxID=2212470 RepID=A0A948RY22_UNCEI|nr:hypothetical protein [Candidatus Eisenbacteria bacterium]MBU1949808.1 hypothetical protein [Candidatus Eisenbacteria bacterium]MBU2691694.1 hypothetical protein [Candidatus Eisenbacteria bacterium]
MKRYDTISRPVLPSLVAVVAAAVFHLWLPAALAYEQPRNTISLGFQLQYGMINGQTEELPEDVVFGAWPKLFESGEGIAIRLKYSTARNRAFGLSLEDQRYRRKSGLGSAYPKQLQMTLYMLDYYLYFHRPTRTSRYIVFGAGLFRPVIREITKEPVSGRELEQDIFPGEDLVISVGGGIEYFVGRRAAIDFSIRAYGYRSEPTLTGSGEVAIGLHYYTK